MEAINLVYGSSSSSLSNTSGILPIGNGGGGSGTGGGVAITIPNVNILEEVGFSINVYIYELLKH